MNLLAVEELSFAYEGHLILNRLTLLLKKGEIGALIGISGSGKTTLFKLLTGILKPKQGTISILGKQLPEGRGNVSYMTQADLLLPWRTVLSNMLLTTELGIIPKNKDELYQEARALLRDIEMAHCEELFPDQLSGGMRQRVSLGRALLQNRPLLLLDEPFGSLDIVLREQMYLLLRALQKKYATTLLMVTHDFRDALALADRIFLLSDGGISHEWVVSDEARKGTLESMQLLEEMRVKIQPKRY